MSRRLHDVFQIWLGVTAALLASAIFTNQLLAQAGEQREMLEKLRWLLNFAKYVEWNDKDFPSNSPVTFVILGDNPFGRKELESIEQVSIVTNRQAKVVKCKNVEEVLELPTCNILFISSSSPERRNLARTLMPFKHRRILTISDFDGFIKEGGIASVAWKQRGPGKFDILPEVNLDAAKVAQLEFDSRFIGFLKNYQADFNK